MSDKPRSTMENLALAMYVHAAQMIKAGKTHAEIERDLVARGVSPETAQTMLQRIDTTRDKITRRAGRRKQMIGALICAAGLSIAFGVFSDVPSGAGMVFAWASVVFGAFWLVRGTLQMTM